MNFFFENKTLFFSTGCLFLLASIIFHFIEYRKYSLITLVVAAFFLFLFSATLNSFLNVWDERFHALVAKNLTEHWLMPTLYDDPVVIMDYDRWDRYHVWLHKQPLFLWQIAASFKLFGINEFTLRLPSVVLGCLLVFAGYRSGKILGNENTGYYTGFLLATSFTIAELIAGGINTDHNDVAFIVYVSLSIWSCLEYIQSGKKYWLILTGFFSGAAILCKWLTGLLVYVCWAIYAGIRNKFDLKKYWDIFISALITAIVFLPWQLLILKWYPTEAKISYENNTKHLHEAFDGHEGTFSYHFDLINENYGNYFYYLVIPAMIIYYIKAKDKAISVSLILVVVLVFLFFSYVPTKMPMYTLVILLPFYITIAFLFDFALNIFSKIKIHRIIIKLLLIAVFAFYSFARIDVNKLKEKHSLWGSENKCHEMLKHNKDVFKKLNLPPNAVLFNVSGRHYIEAMFYTGLPAYNFIPAQDQYTDLKTKKRIIVIFKPINENIPLYLSQDSTVIILSDTLKLCE